MAESIICAATTENTANTGDLILLLFAIIITILAIKTSDTINDKINILITLTGTTLIISLFTGLPILYAFIFGCPIPVISRDITEKLKNKGKGAGNDKTDS